MVWSETELRRVRTIEAKLNEIQTALNNLATSRGVKNSLALIQGNLASLSDDLEQLSITGAGPALEAHKSLDHHTQYHTDYRGDLRYFRENEFIATSAGTGDAGKPIKLDSAGLLDPSFVELTLESHTTLADIGTNTHPQIDTHIADNTLHFLEGDIDHGTISGLADDDHTQYFNTTRGDARYYTETELDAGQLDDRYYTETEVDTIASGVNHGDLENLSSDDHSIYLLANGSRTATGTLTFDEEYDNGTQDGAYTIDWNNGQKQKITLDGAATITLTPPTSGVGNLQLRVIQDDPGSRIITWADSILFPAATEPTLTTTADGEDIMSFFWNGISWYGVATLEFG